MLIKSEKWYQRRLAKYFEDHYGEHEDDVEFFPDPAFNQWLFDIPQNNVRVELTCDINGNVYEQVYRKE